METGIPGAIVAIVAGIALYTGWDGFALWLRVVLGGVVVLATVLAVVSMATPAWPAMDLAEPAAPAEPPAPDDDDPAP